VETKYLPLKATDKIVFLCMLVAMFLDGDLGEKIILGLMAIISHPPPPPEYKMSSIYL